MDDERRTVYQHLKRMQPRLEMYLGTRSIKRLEAYLHGYEAALSVHGIEEEGAPSFAQFPSWLELSLRIGVSRGWARALLDYCGDEEKALARFFALAEEFGALSSVPGETLTLRPDQDRTADFHALNSAQPVPTRLQLMYLRPGDWCYLREWYGDQPQDRNFGRDAAGVLWLVEWEFGIPPSEWQIEGLTPLPYPVPRLSLKARRP